MAQTAFTVRMEADTKKRFDELCRDFGMSANTAINVFARAVVREERIPFEVETETEREKRIAAKRFGELFYKLREDVQKRDVPEMSLDEINDLIKETRNKMRMEGKK